MMPSKHTGLLQAARKEAKGAGMRVHEEEVGSIIKLLWMHRNAQKRASYRKLVSDMSGEEQWAHTKGVAKKWGIEVMGKEEEDVLSEAETRSGKLPWESVGKRGRGGAVGKEEGLASQGEGRGKRKESAMGKGRTNGGGGGAASAAKSAGGNKQGGGGVVGGGVPSEPAWEDGTLEPSEWHDPILTQGEIISDTTGVALVNRREFLDRVADFVVSLKPLAVILPGTPQWFKDADRSDAATDMLNKAKIIDFTFVYLASDGSTVRTPKKGMLVQVGQSNVEQYIPEMQTIKVKSYRELTLTVLEDSVPAEVWKLVKSKAEKFFLDNLGRLMGAPPAIFRKRSPYDVAGGKQMVITVEPQHVDVILAQADRHHMFARPTWRSEEADVKDPFEVLWIPRTASPIAEEIKLAREKAMRYAGADYGGITVRGTNGDRLQLGVRLREGAKDRIQHHFRAEEDLPIQEARGMKSNFAWVLKGLPRNMTPKEVAAATHATLGWTIVAHKELSRPGAYKTVWLIGSEDPPPVSTWWVKANHERHLITIVEKQGDKGGRKGGKGGEAEPLRRKGDVPQPVKVQKAAGVQMGGRGTKRALQDNAQHHDMAVDETAQATPVDEGNESVNVGDDPYMIFHDAQDAGRGSAPSQASAVGSRCGGDDGEQVVDLSAARSRGDGSQSESSYQPRRGAQRRVGPYGKTSKGKGQIFPEGLPKGSLWADQEEEMWEEAGEDQQESVTGGTKGTRLENQPQVAAQANGAPTYTPATGAEQMLASMQSALSLIFAKLDERDKEWARAREEDKAAAVVHQTQIAAYIEEKMEAKMVEVKRYVSGVNTTAIVNEGRGRRRQTSPTVSSSGSADSFTLTQEDGQGQQGQPSGQMVRDSRASRVTKRRTQLSDGEDRAMAGDESTPH